MSHKQRKMGRNLNCYVVIADRKGGSQTRRLNGIIAVEEINVLHVSGDQFMLNVRCDVTYVFNRLAVLNVFLLMLCISELVSKQHMLLSVHFHNVLYEGGAVGDAQRHLISCLPYLLIHQVLHVCPKSKSSQFWQAG
jgi:hypothetical protein